VSYQFVVMHNKICFN